MNLKRLDILQPTRKSTFMFHDCLCFLMATPSPVQLQYLLGIQPQLQHVVAQGEERGQGEGAHEDRDEAVPANCTVLN